MFQELIAMVKREYDDSVILDADGPRLVVDLLHRIEAADSKPGQSINSR